MKPSSKEPNTNHRTVCPSRKPTERAGAASLISAETYEDIVVELAIEERGQSTCCSIPENVSLWARNPPAWAFSASRRTPQQ